MRLTPVIGSHRSPTLAYDYGNYDGFYLSVGLNKEVALTDQLTLGVEMSLAQAMMTT